MTAAEAQGVGEVFAQRMRAVRKRRDLTQAQLADRLEDIGVTGLGRGTLSKIEANVNGRAANVSIQDALAICAALNVAPVHMLAPDSEGGEWTEVRVAPKLVRRSTQVRAWIRGEWPLGHDDDPRAFFAEMPPHEFREMAERGTRRSSEEGRMVGGEAFVQHEEEQR